MSLRQALHSLLHPDRPSKAAENQRIVFFPTSGYRIRTDAWHIPIHGWIYRPAEFSHLRRSTLRVLNHALGLHAARGTTARLLYETRMAALLADNDRWERIRIRFGDAVFAMKRSRANGHFHGSFSIPDSRLLSLLTPGHDHWLGFSALTPHKGSSPFTGHVQLLEPHGLSVISDIDDTIKITEVFDRRKMLCNTFLHDFTCVPGMPAAYARLAAAGAAFHYVSCSPWHLYPALADFLRAQQFPAGSWHLKIVRLAGGDFLRTLRNSQTVKRRHIEALFRAFPHRRFILIGDTGEQDPEIYAYFASKYPSQIEHVYLRTMPTSTFARMHKLFKLYSPMPGKKWSLIGSAHEIQP